MNLVFTLAVIFVLLTIMAYWRLSLLTVSWLTVFILLIYGWFSGHQPWLWGLVLLIFVPLNMREFRQKYFSRQLLKYFRKKNKPAAHSPPANNNAGSLWWETELMQGAPDWQQLDRMPAARLTSEERAFLDGPIEQLCEQLNQGLDLTDTDLWSRLKKLKLYGLSIEHHYSGLGFSACAQSLVLQKIAGVKPELALFLGLVNGQGVSPLLQSAGTELQKQRYLPRIARGELLCCFAMSYPDQRLKMSDTATICRSNWNQREQLGIQLNWQRRLIPLAPSANLFAIMVQLLDPEHMLSDDSDAGLACVLLPTDKFDLKIQSHPGNSSLLTLGHARAENIFVPFSYVIGEVKDHRQGWASLLTSIVPAQCINWPAISTGISRQLALQSGAYRRLKRLGEPQAYPVPIACLSRLAGNAYLMRATSRMSITALDLGERPAHLSLLQKILLSERAGESARLSTEIFAEASLAREQSPLVTQTNQVLPYLLQLAGSNTELKRLLSEPGLYRGHPYLQVMHEAISQDDETAALVQFDRLLFSHIGYSLGNYCRCFWLGITGGRMMLPPHWDETSTYYRQLSRLSANLALLIDICWYGYRDKPQLRQQLLLRCNELLAQLYLASAILKYHQDEGRPRSDLVLLHWTLKDILYQAQQQLQGLIENQPARWMRRGLRLLLLPWGPFARQPSDNLSLQVAEMLQKPSLFRERMGQHLYLGHPAYEQALQHLNELEPLLLRLADAGLCLGELSFTELAKQAMESDLLSPAEQHQLQQAEQLRQQVLMAHPSSAHSTSDEKKSS